MYDNTSNRCLCISETWLHAQLGDKEVSVEGYNIIRKDRTNKIGGGVCVYVKSSLTIIDRNDTISQYDIETILLEFKCKENNFLVCCVYRPPNSGPDFFDIFTEMLETIIMNDNDLIILGDFNINYSIGDNTHWNVFFLCISLLTNQHASLPPLLLALTSYLLQCQILMLLVMLVRLLKVTTT